MEAIFAPIILVAIAFGIFVAARSDGSPSEKAMLVLIICVGGVIGGAIIVALIMTSPLLAVLALIFVCAAIFVIFQGLFGDAVANKKFAKTSTTTNAVSSASANEVIRMFANIKVGDLRNFGKYRWIVADIKGDKAMLVTDKVVLKNELHKKSENITWKDCTLRKYLNGSFLMNSFGAGERSLILTTNVENCNQTSQGRQPLPETEDKIFIWSYKEAGKYTKTAKCPPPSDFTARRCWTRTTNGMWAYTYDCENGPGNELNDTSPACVNGGVRPVMWVKIK